MRNFKIAIVGAGPAGYFTAQAFQNAQTVERSFAIDMIERLPTPWGLVRSGVAPDHPKIKSVSKVFEKIAKINGFRLFANVELGKDISIRDLRENYDAVVIATGAAQGRKLEIQGEELNNCLTAAEFVSWYNGHPDFTDVNVDLSTETAVVIGAGNVAMDIARMLVTDPSKLDSTDTADHALAILKLSKIKKVVICGRRGPEHAAFTAPELRDLLKLENTAVNFEQSQIDQALIRVVQIGEVEKDLKSKLASMKIISEQDTKNVPKRLDIKFLATPVKISGNKRVAEIEFVKNDIKDGKVIATDKTFSIKAGLVITAIGYDSKVFPGINVQNGRILNTAGHVEQNIYVTGWAKRGPTGVIGTNKSDASDVVELIIDNLQEPKITYGIDRILKSGHQVISQVGWEKINAAEVIAGELVGKPRLKETDWNRLISLGTIKNSLNLPNNM